MGKVTNAGTIQSYVAAHSAIYFDAGGSVSNTGTISGGLNGVSVQGGAATVTNSRARSRGRASTAPTCAAAARSPTRAEARSPAAISASTFTGGAGSITNAGAISGGTASVEFAGAGTNTLTLQTGSTLTGAAIGSMASGATNALVLEGTGTADNSFDNFDTLTANASGVWTLEASFANAHEVLVSSGTLDFEGAVTGTGTDTISGASTLEFDSTVAATQTIDFSGRGGTLDLADPLGYAGSHIKDFGAMLYRLPPMCNLCGRHGRPGE